MGTIEAITAAYSILKSISPTRQAALPSGMKYITGYRQVDGDIYKDGDIVEDSGTGLPIARWSYSRQDFQPLQGLTKQGFPRFSDDPGNWSMPEWDETFSGPDTALMTKAAQWKTKAGWYGPTADPITTGLNGKPSFSMIAAIAGGIAAIVTGTPAPLLAILPVIVEKLPQMNGGTKPERLR